MSASFFLDTNILVYSFDHSAPKKRDQARDLIQQALVFGTGVISFQVVQEFINFALKDKSRAMTLEQTKQYFNKVLRPLNCVQSSPALYHQAFLIKERTKFSWYDSIIVAGALQAGCKKLYSEDLQHKRVVDGMMICNPFIE